MATGHELFWPGSLYAMIMLVIWLRGHRLKKRLAQLVEAAGLRIGLKRVDPRKGNSPDNSREKTSGKSSGEATTDVSPQISTEVSPQIPSEVSPQITAVSPQG